MDLSSISLTIYAMLAATALPYLLAVATRALGNFDAVQHHGQPRAKYLNHLTGKAARAHAAEKNSYETLAFFYASVLMAQLMVVPQYSITKLAWLYVLFRAGYALAYIFDKSSLRSSLWMLSMACPSLLFGLCLQV